DRDAFRAIQGRGPAERAALSRAVGCDDRADTRPSPPDLAAASDSGRMDGHRRARRAPGRVTDGGCAMNRIGEADRFRSGSWLERTVDRWRRGRGTAAPPILRRAFEWFLDRLPGDHLVSAMPGGERMRLSARHRHLSWNPV